MGQSKEIFMEMRQQGYDVDCSGMMYQEPGQVLEVVHTNFGFFSSATLEGEEITKEELYKILGIEDLRGFRIELYLTNLQRNSNRYDVRIYERNVE